MRRVVLAAVLLASFSISRSLACSCSGPEHEWAIRGSSAIFAAEVLAADQHPSSIYLTRFQIRVLAVWKGDIAESTYVDAHQSSACGYPFEVGHRYLIYMTARDVKERQVELCSGTGPLDALYYDQYLLGEPVTRYDPSYETVTLDTMLGLIMHEGPEAEDFAWQFSFFQYEAALLLPRLLRVANGYTRGNQIAGLRAIGVLGSSAESAFPHLGDRQYWWTEKNPSVTAERILAMANICGDFVRMKDVLTRALADPSPIIRTAAVRSFERFRDPHNDRAEIVRRLRIALDDNDAGVRDAAIRGLRYDRDAEATRRIRTMLRSDPDANVRSEAEHFLKWQDHWAKLARKSGTVKDRDLERPKKSR